MSLIDASTSSRFVQIGDIRAANEPAVTIHHEVPPFAEMELERLYGNIYSSLKEWRVAGKLRDGVCSYVERAGESVVSIYLFHARGREIRVLNEGIPVGDAEAGRFSKRLFEQYPQACAISFHAVRSTVRNPGYPYRCYNCLEDIVLPLPASGDAYLASMGNATRSYIKRYLNKTKRSFPLFRHDVVTGADIKESELLDVIALNRLRMEGKGKVQGIDDSELRRIVSLARECGMLSVLRIDGRICAGTINLRAGDNYFLEVIAHDPAYNDYRLGTLCCYLTICECIARGGREYHFMWGPQEYKFRLGGMLQELDHVTIYRSRWHALLCPAMAWRNVRQEWSRRGRSWLRNAANGGDRTERLLARFIMLMRGLARR